jgi:parvulin-like peptidyl-prolyl isomerase
MFGKFDKSKLQNLSQNLPNVPKFNRPNLADATTKVNGIGNYLNGRVNSRYLAHPAVRWAILALLVIYIGIGAIVGWKVYSAKAESTNVRRILAVYPLPAVVMPQDIIFVRDYLNQLKHLRHFSEKIKQTLPPDNELRAQLINQMVETRILLHTLQKYDIAVTKGDIDAAYQKISEENGGTSELQKLLTDLYGMNEAEFRMLIRDQLLREKVRKEVLVQVQPAHILVRDEAKARELLDRVKADPSKFGEIAKQESQDTNSRDKDGDLGYISRGVMPQAFDDAAFALKKGEFTQDIVKTDLGFHIIKLTDRKGQVDQTYANFIKEQRDKTKTWILIKS